jgi:hypothetical protein
MKIVGLDLSINGSGCVSFELDNDLEIKNMKYLSFTTVKKNSFKTDTDGVLYFNKKQFGNYFEQNRWMKDHIVDFCKGSEYISIEDYAYSATGRVFSLAEFEGLVKYCLYDFGYKLRLYDICSVKMYACNNGTAKKEDMVDTFDKIRKNPLGLNFFNRFGSPKEDIVDAFFLTELLQLELKLRKGLVVLKDLSEKQIQIFNRTTIGNKINLLSRDFYTKT